MKVETVIEAQTGITSAGGYYFKKCGDTPGLVTLRCSMRRGSPRADMVEVELPGNQEEAQSFIAAYLEAIQLELAREQRR